MKNKNLMTSLFIFTLLFGSCNLNPHNWTKEQKEEVRKKCVDRIVETGEYKATAENICDCTTQKTMESYTYEDSKNLTRDELTKIFKDCQFQW